jgi:hypothetical protein
LSQIKIPQISPIFHLVAPSEGLRAAALKRLDRWLDQEVVKELDIDWIDEPYRKAVW